MTDFPEIQPFGPRPAPQNGDPPNEPAPQGAPSPPTSVTAPSRSDVNAGVILIAVAAGFALGYVVARYQEIILRESKFDELVDTLQAWIREQGPKLADPIRQSLESAGSTWDEAVKKVGSRRGVRSFNFFGR
ncbi:MAG TPA: hypothetical protein VE860_10330 [Chthoniobacterales bacterium]|nr:hypothetical protein [Chthoniobacterales bacterium]